MPTSNSEKTTSETDNMVNSQISAETPDKSEVKNKQFRLAKIENGARKLVMSFDQGSIIKIIKNNTSTNKKDQLQMLVLV